MLTRLDFRPQILQALTERPGQKLVGLYAYLCIPLSQRSTFDRHMRDLCEKGIITRVKSETNGNSIRYIITPKEFCDHE